MSKAIDMLLNLIGKDVSASKVIKEVGGHAGDLGKHFDKAGTHAGVFGKIGKGAMIGVAGAAGALATGVGLAVPALVAMGKNAAEDEKAQARLAQALKNSVGATDEQVASVEKYISKMGEATGIADDQMRPAFQKMVQATGDVAKAQDMMSIAMDISAGSGKSLEAVSQGLLRASNGNVAALGRYGISTKDAEGKTMAFKDVLASAAETFGGQSARAAESLEGRMGRLKLMFDETKESIGAKLLPIFEKVIGFIFNSAIPTIREWAETLMPKLKAIWDSVAETIENNRPGLEKLGDMFKKVAGWIATQLIPVLADLSGKQLKAVITVISKVGEVLPGIIAHLLNFASEAVGAFKGLYTAVTAVLEGILTVAEKTLGWIPGIGEKIKTAKDGFSKFRDDTITKLGEVETGLKNASTAVANYGRDAENVKRAEIKADINDLQAKLATARAELKDPDLSKDRKADIKANIDDLQDKVKTAKARLSEVDSKTVKVGVDLHFTKSGENYIRTPGGKLLPLAEGGIVTRPTLALIGEAGPEAVVPLSRYTNAVTGAYSGSGGGDLHVHFEGAIIGSKEDLARYVTEAQLDYKRRRGGMELGIA